MVKLLASLGVGASLLASRLAAAAENANKNGTRMVTAIFFESYATVALRRTLRYAGDEGFVASMPQLAPCPDQPQTRIPFLAGNKGGVGREVDHEDTYGCDEEYGLGGDASMVGMARYVAVAPRDVSTSLQYLDFVL